MVIVIVIGRYINNETEYNKKIDVVRQISPYNIYYDDNQPYKMTNNEPVQLKMTK
jgi:hypothetical protein